MWNQMSFSALPSSSASALAGILVDCAESRGIGTHSMSVSTTTVCGMRVGRIALPLEPELDAERPAPDRAGGRRPACHPALLTNEVCRQLEELVEIPVHAGGPHIVHSRKNVWRAGAVQRGIQARLADRRRQAFDAGADFDRAEAAIDKR